MKMNKLIGTLVFLGFIGAVSSVTADTLFNEDFSGNTSQWSIAGSPSPSIITNDGNPSPSFSTNDDLNYGGHALSKQTFDYQNGLNISLDMKPGNASFPDQRFASFSLRSSNSLRTEGSNIRMDKAIISVTLTADNYGSTPGWGEKTPGPWISFSTLYTGVNEEDEYERENELPLSSGSGWHNIEVEIASDQIVKFYLDGTLLHTSTNPIPTDYDGDAAVNIGGRLSYYDNIIVSGVTVIEPANPLVVDPVSLVIETGKSGSCTISGGTPPYAASSNFPNVATVGGVGVNGKFNVTGVSVGQAIITVTDSNSGSESVGVTVTTPSTLLSVGIEANEEKDSLKVLRGEQVTFCFSLDPGGYEGIVAEYWFAAILPSSGQWLCPILLPPSMTECDQNVPRIVGIAPIAEYVDECFLTLSDLELGTYIFYLMVKWDEGYVYDQVEVTVD